MSSAKKQLLSGARILLVEDNLLIAMEVEKTLEEYGAEVVICIGSAEAISAMDSGHFDFLLTDYALGGASILPMLHLAAGRNIPLAILTGYPAHHLAEGAHGLKIFEKPFREADIVEHIASILSRNTVVENEPPVE